MQQLIRYGLAGVVNTAVGYAAFLLFFYVAGLSAWLANVLSYAFGLLSAYTLNRVYVFTDAAVLTDTADKHDKSANPNSTTKSSPTKNSAYRFAVAFLVAFALNQLVLFVLHSWLHMPAQWAQLGAMGCYTVVFYVLNKWYVFAPKKVR